MLNIVGNPYTVRVQHQTLYRLAPPLRAARFQIAFLGIAREASVGLIAAEHDNLMHDRPYDGALSSLSFHLFALLRLKRTTSTDQQKTEWAGAGT